MLKSLNNSKAKNLTHPHVSDDTLECVGQISIHIEREPTSILDGELGLFRGMAIALRGHHIAIYRESSRVLLVTDSAVRQTDFVVSLVATRFIEGHDYGFEGKSLPIDQ